MLIRIKLIYFLRAQGIDYGATISAPHMHAMALEYLKDYLKPGNKVLDVGSGSGYL
jgi:protein-L-isoaspartate(D-aspartate) O-methyltransferase